MKNLVLLFALFFTLNTQLHAEEKFTSKSKKAIRHLKESRKLYSSRSYEEALKLAEKSLKSDPEFIEALMAKAYILMAQNKTDAALNTFEKIITLNPSFFPGNHLDLGILYYQKQRYKDAADLLQRYIKQYTPKANTLTKAQKYIDASLFSIHSLAHPVPFNPENLGPKVNSKLKEYNPVLDIAQEVLTFTRTSPDNNAPSGKREDIFNSLNTGGNFGNAYALPSPLNSELREGAPSLTADGKMMVLTICDFYGKYGKGRHGFGSCDLFVSSKRKGRWTNPRNLGKAVNTPYFDSQSSISSNGKDIYFSSARPGGKGGSDIYVISIEKGGFTKAKNLGAIINTAGNEEGVFIHPDNQTLYFTSTGHPGLGASDIFMSRKQSDGSWGKPINLGYPINTHEEEWGLTIDSKGEYAYFSSDRAGGFGDMDLYRFKLPKQLSPQPVTYMRGKVFDVTNKNKFLDAKFELIDLETGKKQVESYANPNNGEFFVCLPSGKEYLLNVAQDGYLFYSNNFSLSSSKDLKPYEKDIPLTPVGEGTPVALKNVFFETGKYDLKKESITELNILKRFLEVNASIKIEISGHTDNVGSSANNLTLSQQRAEAVLKYLVDNGIDPSRLSAKGYGDTKPIDSNDTSDGRANNRRTEFVVKSLK